MNIVLFIILVWVLKNMWDDTDERLKKLENMMSDKQTNETEIKEN